MLTPAMAEQKRPQAYREREARAAKRRQKEATRAAVHSPSMERPAARAKAPAYLPDAALADMVFEPLYITASPLPPPPAFGMASPALTPINPFLGTPFQELGPPTETLTLGGSRPTRLQPAYCAIPDESASLYSLIDQKLADKAAKNGTVDDARRPESKAGPGEEGAKADQGQLDGKKEKDEEDKDGDGEKKDEADEAEAKAGKAKKDGDEKEGKGKKRGKKQKLRKVGDDETPGPNLAEIPRPETEMVMLRREPQLRTESAPSFTTPEAPTFTIPRGAKPEPPTRDQQQALVQFKEAMIAARRLHEELVADSVLVAARVQATTDRLAGLRQRDLDQAVDSFGPRAHGHPRASRRAGGCGASARRAEGAADARHDLGCRGLRSRPAFRRQDRRGRDPQGA